MGVRKLQFNLLDSRFVDESLKNQVQKLLAKGVSTEDAIMEEMSKEKSQLEELISQGKYKSKVVSIYAVLYIHCVLILGRR